eukprot:2262280-Pyramimonas_sp.AAC.1
MAAWMTTRGARGYVSRMAELLLHPIKPTRIDRFRKNHTRNRIKRKFLCDTSSLLSGVFKSHGCPPICDPGCSVASGEGHETPGKPPVASTPAA